MIASSIYLESVPDSNFPGVNLQRLLRLGDVLRHYVRPFMVAGEWNATPSNLESLGLLDVFPAECVVPHGEGTCRSAQGTYRSLDYWVVSPSLAKACQGPHSEASRRRS